MRQQTNWQAKAIPYVALCSVIGFLVLCGAVGREHPNAVVLYGTLALGVLVTLSLTAKGRPVDPSPRSRAADEAIARRQAELESSVRGHQALTSTSS